MDLTTPALLFPAISLLMLAYTNRFITLAQLARDLHAEYKENANATIVRQIANLRTRIILIKYMQIFGALSFFFCVACMFLLFAGSDMIANVIFGLSLILLLISLGLLILELHISINALTIQLEDTTDHQLGKGGH